MSEAKIVENRSEVRAAHTPGPWIHAGFFGGSEYIETSCGRMHVASVYGRKGEAQANAALIAAAPEMLAALRNALHAHDDELRAGGQVYTDGDEIRAAIAKAEGRS